MINSRHPSAAPAEEWEVNGNLFGRSVVNESASPLDGVDRDLVRAVFLTGATLLNADASGTAVKAVPGICLPTDGTGRLNAMATSARRRLIGSTPGELFRPDWCRTSFIQRSICPNSNSRTFNYVRACCYKSLTLE